MNICKNYLDYSLLSKAYQTFSTTSWYIHYVLVWKNHKHICSILTREKNNKTSHVIAWTKCNSSSTLPLDIKLCRQLHMTRMKYYKFYQIFLGRGTIYHKKVLLNMDSITDKDTQILKYPNLHMSEYLAILTHGKSFMHSTQVDLPEIKCEFQ